MNFFFAAQQAFLDKAINNSFNFYIVQGDLNSLIGLITVFDTILTGRQSGQKLKCLYGNPIANYFFQN